MIDPLTAAPSGPHPTPDALYRARHEPRTARSEAILAHAAICAACSEELLRQEAFDTPEPLPERQLESAWTRFQARDATPVAAQASAKTGLGSPSWRPALLLAATLTACVLGLSLWRLGSHPPRPALPQPPPPPVETTRGGPDIPDAATPLEVLAAPPTELVFTPDGDIPLQVTLWDEGRTYSWTSQPTTLGRTPFPPAERAKLRPGVVYYWTVLSGSGVPSDEIARSFRISPAHP